MEKGREPTSAAVPDLDPELDLLEPSDDPSRSSQPPPPKPARFHPKLRPRPKPEQDSPSLPKKKHKEDSTLPTPHAMEKPSPSLKFSEESDQIQGSTMDVDGDGEDRVVREIDVFLTPSPLDTSAQLYVMQYPLRSSWRPYGLNQRCIEVRVKPRQSKLEVDLEVNMDEKNYDPGVAEHFRIQKQTLSASNASMVTSYAVGILIKNKLHLNPVHAIVQFRPSMAYLAGSVEDKANSNMVTKGDSATATRMPGKLVRGTGDDKNTDEEEPWVPLQYHDIGSSFSIAYQQKMVAEERSHIKFSMSPHDYINSLCPGTSGDDSRVEGPERRLLLSLPLEERFKKWLSEGPHVHRFRALMHLAPANSKEDVLEVLQQYADLVQGLWVAKSSLRSDVDEARARDYILLLFTASRFIRYDELKGLKVSNGILKRILSQLAVERSAFQDWKFKECEDDEFIRNHPDIVEGQKHSWSSRSKHITDAIHGVGRSSSAVTKNSSKPGLPSRIATSGDADKGTKVVDGVSSSGKMSEETREALPKALMELFRMHKACSLQLIRRGLRDMAVSKSTHPKADARMEIAAAQGAEALPELESMLNELAICVHGVYVLKSLGIASVDPLRGVVIDLFCGMQPNAKLKRADIMEAAKIKLKREVSDAEYVQVLHELCVPVKGNAWMLKSGDGKYK